MGSIKLTHRQALFLCLAVAGVLRLVQISARPLWYDEAFAVLFAGKGLTAMLYGTLTPVAGGAADIHPLLYYALLSTWMSIFGTGAVAVRLLSVLLGTVSVGLLYLVGRALFSPRTGLAAAWVLAGAAFHVQYSQEVRMYALLGCLLLSATYCFIRAWRSPTNGWRWWGAFGLCAGLAMYTQQLAAFYLLALALFPLLARRWDVFKGVLLGALVALLLYAPWLVQLPAQFAKVRSYYWIDPPNAAAFIRVAYSFLVVNLDLPNTAKMVGLLGAAFLLLFLWVQVFLRRRSAERGAVALVVWLAFAPVLLLWLFSVLVQPVFLERALLPSALLWYLALGWLFTAARLPNVIRGGLVGLWLVLCGIGLYHQYTWRQFPNSPYDGAMQAIQSAWQSGDVIIHPNKLTALPSVYYAPMLDQRYLADRPGSPDDTLALPTQEVLGLLGQACVAEAAAGATRVWWLTYTFAQEAYAAADNSAYQAALDWLTAHYTPIATQRLNDLEWVLYADARDVTAEGRCS